MSDTEREVFEREVRNRAEKEGFTHVDLRLTMVGGTYSDKEMQLAWWGWRRRAELQNKTAIHHRLKILSCYHEAVMNGSKRFEIRENGDRGFQKGDTVSFIESPIATTKGRKTPVFVITYVTNYGQPDGQVVFGFKEIGELQCTTKD